MFSSIIAFIKLLFAKDKELYVFIHSLTGYFPRHIEFYRLALVHRSKPIKLPDGNWANNERLEFLGDAILDAAVGAYLYEKYPDKHEGFLTATRAKVVQRDNLNRIGRQLKIEGHVRASAHSSSHNSYILGNTLEALVGAIYLDRGYEVASRFIVKKIIGKHTNLDTLVKTEQDFKSRLIEWTQKFRVQIEFMLVDTTTDESNNPIFKTAVILAGQYAADATGYSKKESHQGASKKTLERIQTDHVFRELVMAQSQDPPSNHQQ